MTKKLIVGDRIKARYANNLVGNYFDGTIIKVTESYPMRSGWFEEKNIILSYLCCCHIWYPPRKYYDIKYDNGNFEKRVSSENVKLI